MSRLSKIAEANPWRTNPWFESVAVAQRRAKKKLPHSVYMALVGGSEQGVTLDDNSLQLKLEPDLMLQARRLGRWRMSHQDGITTRSCNARIDLGSEVVYGVLRISSSTGTSLIWPQQKLEIPDLHFSSTHSMPRESHLDTPSAQPGHP